MTAKNATGTGAGTPKAKTPRKGQSISAKNKTLENKKEKLEAEVEKLKKELDNAVKKLEAVDKKLEEISFKNYVERYGTKNIKGFLEDVEKQG